MLRREATSSCFPKSRFSPRVVVSRPPRLWFTVLFCVSDRILLFRNSKPNKPMYPAHPWRNYCSIPLFLRERRRGDAAIGSPRVFTASFWSCCAKRRGFTDRGIPSKSRNRRMPDLATQARRHNVCGVLISRLIRQREFIDGAEQPVLVVEDDPWTRLIAVVLDPTTSQERWTAFADFMSPDLPDFRGWCDKVRRAAPLLFPSEVKLVSSIRELQSNLETAEAIVTESLSVGKEELALAPRLKVVHKYGMLLRNIDVVACDAHGVKVLGVRRRANISCAEHAFAMMLTLARRMGDLDGIISIDQLAGIGREYRPFDSRHTPGANWGRFKGTRIAEREYGRHHRPRRDWP